MQVEAVAGTGTVKIGLPLLLTGGGAVYGEPA